eukprot:6004585-Prymnesium_polylepis.1
MKRSLARALVRPVHGCGLAVAPARGACGRSGQRAPPRLREATKAIQATQATQSHKQSEAARPR